MTARPAHSKGTSRGGAAWPDVESGTTTTVLRRWLTMLVLSTRQGRVFLISEPTVGSRLTHQTSPRAGARWGLVRGAVPGFRDFPGEGVEFTFNGPHLRIGVGDFTGPGKLPLPLSQPLGQGLRQIAGPLTGRNLSREPGCQLFRQSKRHLSHCHTSRLPYSEPRAALILLVTGHSSLP
jgi:hypothetical protein